MAQKILVEMVDDLEGGEANQTVPFGLDGVDYEIDLSDDNARGLRDELARFVAAARRTGGRKIRLAAGQSANGSSGTDRERSREIRAWAQDNDYDVSARGRIASEIVEAFDRAKSAPAPEPVKATRKRATRKKADA
ncbi:histone-like nucleoid-structuring protein Lsr2 [Amycolatopsis sp. H20-H5]|uniref:histone-like nucleoid-structuring protein Lsr2 n=1 Tax=Amycolatopsis sp. H20-H5 TaxID=3046309 RepID=UPI002DB5B57A|nr:Lsr2 family protein [Amycolatopsis sp. H20-H5]MEC3981848.1 Lsr2 family protein [Amycolatopsis sp. H20-H5]